MWAFIKSVVEIRNFSINDVLDTDYQALLRVVTGPPVKQKKEVHTLFDFIEKGGTD